MKHMEWIGWILVITPFVVTCISVFVLYSLFGISMKIKEMNSILNELHNTFYPRKPISMKEIEAMTVKKSPSKKKWARKTSVKGSAVSFEASPKS